MRKKVLLILILVLIPLIVVGAITVKSLYRIAAQKEWSLSTTSPGGTYTVQLRGKTEPPSIYYAHGNHEVSMNVLKNGTNLLMNELIYDGDQYDDLFLDLFPAQEWQAESVLRFGEEHSSPSTQYDTILVTNNSSKTIEYFRVNYNGIELFYIFELSPGANAQLRAESRTDKQSDRSGLVCFGKVEGRTIQGSASFYIHGKYKGPGQYSISIEDTGITIKSREYELDK